LRRHGRTPLRLTYEFRSCGLGGLSRLNLAAVLRRRNNQNATAEDGSMKSRDFIVLAEVKGKY